MNISNKDTIRKRVLSNPRINMQGPVARQGGVVFNAEYDRLTFSKRVQPHETHARPDLALSIAPGYRCRLEILPGEPVFARIRDKSKKRKRHAANPEVISSLNGMRLSELPPENPDDEEHIVETLEDARNRFFALYAFMGFAVTPCETAGVDEARK